MTNPAKETRTKTTGAAASPAATWKVILGTSARTPGLLEERE
jgi:hypothetical protein